MRRILLSPDSDGSAVEATPKIRPFEQRLGGSTTADESWVRKPKPSGTGAVHVRSFHCKMGGDALTYLDRQINEWLDKHPDYDVKFVTMAVGDWSGTVKEPHLVVQVWV